VDDALHAPHPLSVDEAVNAKERLRLFSFSWTAEKVLDTHPISLYLCKAFLLFDLPLLSILIYSPNKLNADLTA
jgi:hypothetical protein